MIEEPGSEHLLNSQHSVLASSYELSRINAFFTLRSLKPLLNYTQSSSEVKLKYTFSVEVSTRWVVNFCFFTSRAAAWSSGTVSSLGDILLLREESISFFSFSAHLILTKRFFRNTFCVILN